MYIQWYDFGLFSDSIPIFIGKFYANFLSHKPEPLYGIIIRNEWYIINFCFILIIFFDKHKSMCKKGWKSIFVSLCRW